MSSVADRPKIEIPLSPTDVALEIVSAVGVAYVVALTLLAMPHLPDRIVTHFDLFGKADGWGSKDTVWILPGMAVLLYLALTIVARFPHTFNYAVPITPVNAKRQYTLAVGMMRWLKTELVCLVAWGAWGMIQVAEGQANGISVWYLPVVLAAISATTIVVLIRSYREQ
jgi:hypothetical protein